MFRLRPEDVDKLTTVQIRQLADRSDEIIRAANKQAEQIGNIDG